MNPLCLVHLIQYSRRILPVPPLGSYIDATPVLSSLSVAGAGACQVGTFPFPAICIDIIEKGCNILGIVWCELRVPLESLRLSVEQQDIMDRPPTLGATVRTGPLPYDLIEEILRPEYCIKQHLQIMTCGRVTVQIQASRGLQHTMQLDNPGRHHGEIRHHVILA